MSALAAPSHPGEVLEELYLAPLGMSAGALHPRKFSGADIKFIRKAIGLKQKDLAGKIEVTVEHLSRCETSAATMSPSSEKLLRIFALKSALKLHKLDPCEEKDQLETALDKLFDVIKPVAVHTVGEQLQFHFQHRRDRPHNASDASDDGRWNETPLSRAA